MVLLAVPVILVLAFPVRICLSASADSMFTAPPSVPEAEHRVMLPPEIVAVVAWVPASLVVP